MEGGKIRKRGEIFVVVVVVFFVCFVLFCFAFHFSKPLNFLLSLG